MDTSLLVALGTAAMAVVVLVVALGESLVQRRALSRTLRQATWDDPEFARVRDRELAQPVSRRLVVPGMARVGALVRRFTPTSVVDRLDQELVYAGSPLNWDGERVLAMKGIAMGAGAVLGFGGTLLLGWPMLRIVLVAAVCAGVGYYLPEWILRSRADARQKQIQKALPDAMDLLSITVQAGLGFDAAMDRVAREVRGPLGGEFYRAVQEMRLGKGRSDALRDMGERSKVQDLKSFTSAMVQAEIFGISIADQLQVKATELRTKRRQRAEEQAQKLPVKIVFPLILCIFPALFTILLGPAAIRIYENILQ